MPTLSSLKSIIFSETEEHGPLLEFGTFLTFLRNNHVHGVDGWKNIKRSNISRKLKDDLIVLNEVEYINLRTIIKFSYQQQDVLQICKDITTDVESHLLKCRCIEIEKSDCKGISSVRDIYFLVVKLDFKHLLQNCDRTILHKADSLYNDYEKDFSKDQWDKIIYFEHHFNKQYPLSKTKTLSEQILLKNDFLKKCQNTEELAVQLKKEHHQVTKNRLERKTETTTLNGVYLRGQHRHLPSIIDQDITNVITSYCDTDAKAFAVDCCGFCKHPPGIHIFVSLNKEYSQSDLHNLGKAIITSISRSHSDNFLEVVFLSCHGTHCHEDEFGAVKRFLFFDDVCQGKLSNDIAFVFKQDEDIEIIYDLPDQCCACFDAFSLEPLHWKTFDISKEWFLDVPLLMQIILQTFINTDSQTRCCDFENFQKSKLTRLYALYDSLLQIHNRNHIGVIQELNTNELVNNYHNVTTVFSITSKAGITQSLRHAERQLKLRSDEDFLYWDSYIRQHPLTYDTECGNVTRSWSLRDCYIVLGLDNLVRLTFKRDPERGQTKSNQVCTLPITLKGIPTDSTAVSSWHDTDICNGEEVCPCKQQRNLGPTSFEKYIMTNSKSEEEVAKRFDTFLTWGLLKVWNNVGILGEFFKSKHEDEQLHTSFDAMSLSNVNLEFSDEEVDKSDEQSSEDEQEDVESYNISDVSSILDDDDDDDDDDNDDDDDKDDESTAKSSDHNEQSVDYDEFSRYDDQEQVELENSIREHFVPLAQWQFKENSSVDINDLQENPFTVFETPEYIEKHPPPATGRDDDISKLKEVLDDVAMKSGKCCLAHPDEQRILLAPDHKIGNNLLKLIRGNPRYRIFLPEFPLLHLRKSKIVNLCSAYKSAGLTQLLMYMHDEEKDTDWLKLISISNIEAATRNIRRLSVTFHVVVMLLFMETLQGPELELLQTQLKSGKITENMQSRYDNFIENKSQDNPTFSLHIDIMKHCDEIVAIYLAERIGGADGYHLLLSAVKSSLPFAFLNGASSYAAFCLQLLQEHYAAGPFWQALKMSLFSTKHKNSSINIALDTQREMDHRDALRGFRPRAGLSAILPRISLVDMFEDVHNTRSTMFDKTNPDVNFQKPEELLKVTPNDMSHILPTAKMMLERLQNSSDRSEAPLNIYTSEQDILSECILDRETFSVGRYLIYRYAARENIFNLTTADVPSLPADAPKVLLQKVKTTKGTTVKRSTCKTGTKKTVSTEKKRQQQVQKLKRDIDCMSSNMNTCQALVKPDCSKATVQKSVGIKNAILFLIKDCLEDNNRDLEKTDFKTEDIYLESKIMQESVTSVKQIFLEFAGVKFKVPERSVGYLEFIEKNIFGNLKNQFPACHHMTVCEEKYLFTPDDLKSATRGNRKKDTSTSIFHLKPASDILCSQSFNKKALTTTMEGKQMISKHLASNVDRLKLTNMILDIDSELHTSECNCDGEKCTCSVYATPIRVVYSSQGFRNKELLNNIQQRKGEAEMAQLDWIIAKENLADGDAILSLVTSGDIDALVIHLFTISRLWPRTADGSFRNTVYLLLQKANKKFDFYCITKLILVLESRYGRGCCSAFAILLCIGGNDFLPKFCGKSHTAVIRAGIVNGEVLQLFDVHSTAKGPRCTLKQEMYYQLIQQLYCPKPFSASKLSFEEIRQLSIKKPGKQFTSPDKWMPPKTVLEKMAQLLCCQIDYLLTAGSSSASLPDFISYGCLKRNESGQIEYNFGNEVKVSSKAELITIPEGELKTSLMAARAVRKRRLDETPQKGRRRKRRPAASTPRKLTLASTSQMRRADRP